jgi:hypothetical protein
MPLNEADRRRADEMRDSLISVLLPKAIYGSGLSFRDATDYLRLVDLRSALDALAVLTAIASDLMRRAIAGNPAPAGSLARLYEFVFASKRTKRVQKESIRLETEALVDRLGVFTPFSPWACSAMADLCLRLCPETGGWVVWPPSIQDKFVWVLLSFQEHLVPERDLGSDLDLDTLGDEHFVAFSRSQYRANPRQYSSADLTRLYAYLEVPEVGALMEEKLHMKPAEWFRGRMGLSPSEYHVLLIAVAATIGRFKSEAANPNDLKFTVDAVTINMTAAARDAFRRFTALATIDPFQIRKLEIPNTWAKALYQSNVLLAHQLYPLPSGELLIVDRDQYINRYFNGVIHVLDDAARSGVSQYSWQSVRSDFGYLFEGYFRWLLVAMFSGAAKVYVGGPVTPGKETDCVVVLGDTAHVFEGNHHPFSRIDAYEATTKQWIDIVEPDIRKAIRAAKSILNGEFAPEGQPIRVARVLPIVMLSDALPISPITAPRFLRDLELRLPEAAGFDVVGGRICATQAVTLEHLELFDRAWDLPKEAKELGTYLESRSRAESLRFGPVQLDRGKIKAKHAGNTVGVLKASASARFSELGPSFFVQASPDQSDKSDGSPNPEIRAKS